MRVGSFAVQLPWSDWYWNNQWSISYNAAFGTLTKTVDLNETDLSAFRVSASSNTGDMTLELSQGSVTKDIDISRSFNQKIDMSGFTAGLVKLHLTIKAATGVKIQISWRR